MGNIDYCYFHGSELMVFNYIIYTIAEKYGLIKKQRFLFCLFLITHLPGDYATS